MKTALATIAFTLAVMCAALSSQPAQAQATPPSVASQMASYVGEQACAKCHPAIDQHFGHTVHARIFRENPRSEAQRHVCESCHGPGSIHVQTPTDRSALIGFTKDWGTPTDVQN